MKYSKKENKVKLNGRMYKFNTWNTWTTVMLSKKIGMAVAPSLGMLADIKLSAKEPSLEELLGEAGGVEMFLSGGLSQLGMNFTDELFEEIIDKLLTGLSFAEQDADGDYGDLKKIEDWDEHFSEFSEDWSEMVYHSFKANLYSFFMSQAIVRSNIDKLMTVVKPILNNVSETMNKNETTDS